MARAFKNKSIFKDNYLYNYFLFIDDTFGCMKIVIFLDNSLKSQVYFLIDVVHGRKVCIPRHP